MVPRADEDVRAGAEPGHRRDTLVNDAGLYHETALPNEDPARVRRVVEVNVLGPMNCMIHAARVMGPGNSIVNTSSGAVACSAFPRPPPTG
jgi:NAD(P)-dependent dehydrogenase (short-subunit alcohol dehydrogenase family)